LRAAGSGIIRDHAKRVVRTGGTKPPDSENDPKQVVSSVAGKQQ